MIHSMRLRWDQSIAAGLACGIIVGLFDLLSQPVGGLSRNDGIEISLELIGRWLVIGLIWSAALKLIEDRGLHPFAMLPILPATALISVIESRIHPLAWLLPAVTSTTARLVDHVPPYDLMAYMLWMNFFFGGVYAIGFEMIRRTARLRYRLAELRRHRTEVEGAIGALRLETFRGQVQPSLLQDALEALQRNFQRSPEKTHDLFDRLVTFLRAAMPSVSSRRSNLASELSVVAAFIDLRQALREDRAPWRIDVDPISQLIDFPELLLLPLLDGISALLPPEAPLTISGRSEDSSFLLTLSSDQSAFLPVDLTQRLRSAFGMSLRGAGDKLPIELALPVGVQ